MPMDEYEDLPLDDSEEEKSEPTAGAKELGLSLARAIKSGNGEAICEMVKKIVAEDY